MSILNFFGLNKVTRLLDIINQNGGFKNSLMILWRMDDLKAGKLVGIDKNGNKYYQSNYYFIGKSRWVVYADKYGFDYDASQVSPEWFGWLHFKTDLLPDEDKSRPNYKWMADPQENLSGTPQQYVPYSTTRRKIEVWQPKSNK